MARPPFAGLAGPAGPAGEPPGERLRREDRIRRREDFLRVQRHGRRVHCPHFVIIVAPSERQRIGITVTKRIARAVGRNRVKRLVREVFRRNRELFPARADVVVVARNGAAELNYERVQAEFRSAAPALGRAARQEAR